MLPATMRIWLAGRPPASLSILELRNCGPIVARELNSLGFRTLDDLLKAGFENAMRAWAEAYPKRVHKIAARALLGALLGLDLRALPPGERQRADTLIESLRHS